MSLADFYALGGAVCVESDLAGDDVVLSPADPGEYKRLARVAQGPLLTDFMDALVLITHVSEWDDGGWRAEAKQFMDRIKAQKDVAADGKSGDDA